MRAFTPWAVLALAVVASCSAPPNTGGAPAGAGLTELEGKGPKPRPTPTPAPTGTPSPNPTATPNATPTPAPPKRGGGLVVEGRLDVQDGLVQDTTATESISVTR